MSALQNTKPMKVCEGCGELFRPSPEEPRASCCNDECKGLKRIQNQRGSETRKVLEDYYKAVLDGTMSMAEASRRLYPVLRDRQRLKWRPKNPDGLLEGQVAVPEAAPKRAKKAKKSPFYSGSFVESSRFVDSFGEPMPAFREGQVPSNPMLLNHDYRPWEWVPNMTIERADNATVEAAVNAAYNSLVKKLEQEAKATKEDDEDDE